MDDLELLEECAAGSNDAWTEFLDRYGRLLRFVIRKSASAGTPNNDLDELYDEIIAWLFEKQGRVLRTYRGDSKLSSWLGVVVTRRVRRLQQQRRGRHGPTVSIDALSLDASTQLTDNHYNDAAYRPEAVDALREALKDLPERDKTLLTGFFLQKRKYDDLAKEIGVKEGSVGQLLTRAKRKLFKAMGGEKFLEKLSGTLCVLLSSIEAFFR